MSLASAEITRHAWLRFLKRWQGDPPPCYRTELETIISRAEPEDLGYGAVIRLVKNGFVPAKYWQSGDWRFVTDEEVTKILTIERRFLKANTRTCENGKTRKRQKH